MGKNSNDAKFYARLFLVGVVIIGGAFFIGTSDAGQIDVAATIQTSNESNNQEVGGSDDDIATVPEAFRNMTNGGLVPQDGTNASAPAPVDPVATTSTSTDDTEAE